MKMAQIALPLGARTGPSPEAFFVSEANRDAVAAVDLWDRWPDGAAMLVGPEASGKSHLARLARERSGGALDLIEDADRLRDDETLFHRLNRAKAGGAALLLTARTAPAAWAVALPDLASRLRALPVITIGEPDDGLMGELLAKALSGHGLRAQPDVIAYLVPRLERSYAAISDAARRLNAASLSSQRAPSVPFARDVLFAKEEGEEER